MEKSIDQMEYEIQTPVRRPLAMLEMALDYHTRGASRGKFAKEPAATITFQVGLSVLSVIREQKVLRYPQAWFVESAHGDGDAQAAGEARGDLDRAQGVGIGSGTSVL